MKSVLFAALLACSTAVLADKIDELRSQDVYFYCQAEAGNFQTGIQYRIYGAAREFKNIPREEFEIRSQMEEPPKDGMYYVDWDQYTKQEREFIELHVLKGYDFATYAINKGLLKETTDKSEVIKFNDFISKQIQKYYENCGQEEAARRVMPKTSFESNLLKSASNERIIPPHSPNTPQQEYCSDLAIMKYNACMVGKNPSKP